MKKPKTAKRRRPLRRASTEAEVRLLISRTEKNLDSWLRRSLSAMKQVQKYSAKSRYYNARLAECAAARENGGQARAIDLSSLED